MENLTFRQRTFLERLWALYHREGNPVHYSLVAEGMGVSGTTAYEMLRLLERKGYVGAIYLLRERGSGPGRSRVVFYPTSKVVESLHLLAQRAYDKEEWEKMKKRILTAVRRGEAADDALFKELLTKIREGGSPLVYCAEVMTAFLLTLREQITSHFKEHPLVRMIMNSDQDLTLLPGMALGMSLAEKANHHLRGRFLNHAQQYQRQLQRMDENARGLLHDFLKEVITAFQG